VKIISLAIVQTDDHMMTSGVNKEIVEYILTHSEEQIGTERVCDLWFLGYFNFF
jgi:CMP-2-keto-3-deoxyoctulosonic acid synthetase